MIMKLKTKRQLVAVAATLLTINFSVAEAARVSLKGTQGVVGAAGAAGVKGDAGAAGAAGVKGDAGAAGAVGAKGDAGPAGAVGAVGAVGAKGDAGEAGAKGDAGPAGPAGTVGAAGVAGVKGDAGPAGTNGSSFIYSMTCGVGGTDACKIGSVGPGGGWIFFVDYNEQYSGFNYLEAAPTDISAVNWCSDTVTSIGAVADRSANAVGAGQANTRAMTVAGACVSGAANSAKAYFTPTTQAGDWFLGSEGEMMLMYTNLRQAGVSSFANGYYWSSTESNSDDAWGQGFDSGVQDYGGKSYTLPIRAVRAF